MNDEQILKLFMRIKKSDDGIDFISYLQQLSNDNYAAFKRNTSEHNDIHKGYAIAIDTLLGIFDTCADRLKKRPAQEEGVQFY